MVAVDGTVFDVPDTGANSGFFGRPGSGRGQQRGAYPQVRVAALVECGTHAVFAAVTGPLSVHERRLIPGLLGRLEPGMLLMADRGITGFELWRAASDTGADLLWRVRKNIVLPALEAFDDGSYLSEIVAAGDRKRRDPVRVRVIEYTLGREDDDTVYRLITTICNPQEASAADLAGLYHQRWEIENTLDEIKTFQGGHHLVLRSQYPDGVEQEIYGFLLVHHALRDVMHRTAHQAGLDPDRLSFTRTLRIARRHVTDQAALSPLTTQSSPDEPQQVAAVTTPAPPPATLHPPCHQTQDGQLAPQTHPPPQPTPTTRSNNHTGHPPNQPASTRKAPKSPAPGRDTCIACITAVNWVQSLVFPPVTVKASGRSRASQDR
ncbi:IS4 family transposase [Streptomyces sp. NPDC059802]|uniref:IS4 family transposase n=1 Tax=Streptomyces sp. NPDC059802 TaxID=3346952 RepID=UPI0036465990